MTTINTSPPAFPTLILSSLRHAIFSHLLPHFLPLTLLSSLSLVSRVAEASSFHTSVLLASVDDSHFKVGLLSGQMWGDLERSSTTMVCQECCWSRHSDGTGDQGTTREGVRPCFLFRSADILAKSTNLWQWREPLEGERHKCISTGPVYRVLI